MRRTSTEPVFLTGDSERFTGQVTRRQIPYARLIFRLLDVPTNHVLDEDLFVADEPVWEFEHDSERSDADTFRHALFRAFNACTFNTDRASVGECTLYETEWTSVGLMLVRSRFDEWAVLAATHSVEQATKWTKRGRPRILRSRELNRLVGHY